MGAILFTLLVGARLTNLPEFEPKETCVMIEGKCYQIIVVPPAATEDLNGK